MKELVFDIRNILTLVTTPLIEIVGVGDITLEKAAVISTSCEIDNMLSASFEVKFTVGLDESTKKVRLCVSDTYGFPFRSVPLTVAVYTPSEIFP